MENVPFYQPDAFLHADQPQTSFASDFFAIKPVANIGYFHSDLIKAAAQSDSASVAWACLPTFRRHSWATRYRHSET
jgi:hypothetical protein